MCDADVLTMDTSDYVTNYTRVTADYTGAAVENTTVLVAGTTKQACKPCSSPNATQQDSMSSSMSVNGGFIAMAAGLSVVVPLICVLIMQLRRAKREERLRERSRATAGEPETGPLDLPPSYEQVFGSNFHPVSVEHSRNNSMEALIEENETGRNRQTETGHSNSHAYVAVVRGQGLATVVDGGGSVRSTYYPINNPLFSNVSVATISGSQVADFPQLTTGSSRLADNVGAAIQSELRTSEPLASTSQFTLPPQALDTQIPEPSSSSSHSSHYPPPSLNNPPNVPPPPVLSSTPPPSLGSQIQLSSGSSGPREPWNRLPGMHISIEDFFASVRGLQEYEPEGPPPSYEEALKILEAAASIKENRIVIH